MIIRGRMGREIFMYIKKILSKIIYISGFIKFQ